MSKEHPADRMLENALKNWLVETKTAPINNSVNDFVELAAPGLNLLSSNKIAAFLYDYTRGSYFYVNDYFATLMNRSKEKIMTDGIQTMQDRVHPDDFPKVLELTQKVLADFLHMTRKNRETVHCRYFFRLKRPNSNEYVWVMQTNRFTVWNAKFPPIDIGYLVELFDAHHSVRVMAVLESAEGKKEYYSDSDAILTANLSKRETEVLFLIRQGKSNKDIAEMLCVSVDTIKSHRKKIMRKLNVSSMIQAVRRIDQNPDSNSPEA